MKTNNTVNYTTTNVMDFKASSFMRKGRANSDIKDMKIIFSLSFELTGGHVMDLQERSETGKTISLWPSMKRLRKTTRRK